MKPATTFQPKQKCYFIFVILFISTISFVGCSKQSVAPGDNPAATDKQITSFTLTMPDGTIFNPQEYAVNINGDAVKVILPPLIKRYGLKATVEYSGESVSPASGSIQNFSAPVIYTVTAKDGTTKQYSVEAAYEKPVSVVFIGAGNKFYALNAETGAARWSFTGGGSFEYSSATYRDNVVYMGCIDNYVYAFNASNGRLLWQYKAGNTGVESDAVIEDSTVYVGCNDDELFALDAVTGLKRWSFMTGGNISSSPKVAGGKVYFGSSDGKFYALQANTGQLVWSFQTGGMINQSGASLVNGHLYFGSRDGYVYSLDAADGSLLWRFGTGSISFEQSSPAVSNGVLYIGGWYNMYDYNVKGSVYAVNAATGDLIWEKLANTAFSSSPFVSDGRLYITGDDLKISALETASGNTLWQKQILPNSASPVEANGKVYVGGGGTGFIYALDAITGNEVWKFPIPGALQTSSPVVIELSGKVDYSGDSGATD